MKILFLPRWFPIPSDPLWGLFVLNHARAVSTQHEVMVLYTEKTVDPQLAGRSPFFAELEGIPVCYNFYTPVKGLVGSRFLTTLKMLLVWLRGWRFVVKQFGTPDLLHVHILTRLGFFAWLVKLRYRIPYVITEHWSRYLPKNLFYHGRLRKWITGIVVRDAGAVMPVTQNLRDAMTGFGLKNPHYLVVPNAVDTSRYSELNNNPICRIFTLVHISTFDDRAKNISGILRVAKMLTEANVQFVLRLVGDGQDFSAMKGYARSLGLSTDTVRFEGAASPSEIPAILSESDVLLIFSHYENMPVVISEALVAGVPVVATRVGGIPEYVDGSNGVLVEPGDEPELCRVLTDMINKGISHFNREQIRQTAVSAFSFSSVGNKISEIYQLATSNHKHV